jgi:hypothetical protein
VTVEGVELTVTAMDGRRVDRVEIRPPAAGKGSDDRDAGTP